MVCTLRIVVSCKAWWGKLALMISRAIFTQNYGVLSFQAAVLCAVEFWFQVSLNASWCYVMERLWRHKNEGNREQYTEWMIRRQQYKVESKSSLEKRYKARNARVEPYNINRKHSSKTQRREYRTRSSTTTYNRNTLLQIQPLRMRLRLTNVTWRHCLSEYNNSYNYCTRTRVKILHVLSVNHDLNADLIASNNWNINNNNLNVLEE